MLFVIDCVLVAWNGAAMTGFAAKLPISITSAQRHVITIFARFIVVPLSWSSR